MGGKTSAKSKNDWIAKAYDRINLTVPKGQKAEIQAVAERNNESVNEYIKKAIAQRMEREKSAPGVVSTSSPAPLCATEDSCPTSPTEG